MQQTASTAVATGPVSEVTGEGIAGKLSLVGNEISATAAKIDVQQVAVLAGHLRRPGRLFVAGAGRSGLVLRMAAMRLMHRGLNVHVAGDTTTPAIGSDDLLLVASGSGTTSGVVESAETAAKAGARIAALTTIRIRR
jgi:6-phospho-3-hexuloisomerase